MFVIRSLFLSLVVVFVVLLSEEAISFSDEDLLCIQRCAQPFADLPYGPFFCGENYNQLTDCIKKDCSAKNESISTERLQLAQSNRAKYCDDRDLRNTSTTVGTTLTHKTLITSKCLTKQEACDPTMVAVAKGLCTVGGLSWCTLACHCGHTEYFYGLLKAGVDCKNI